MPLPCRARFAAAAAASLAGALGCATPGAPPYGEAIRVSGTYVHAATGASFPERIGTLPRSEATKWDAAETNVGVSYQAGQLVRITVYLYPAGDARTGRLRGEFLDTEGSLEQLHPAALRERAAVVRVPAPSGRAVGFEARFKLLEAETVRTTLAQVFQCGRWFLKVRATYAAEYPIDAALEAIHDQVRCRDLALHDPIGTKRGIDYDPNGGAEWLVYAFTQLKWLDEHLAPDDLVYGIPDHDATLFVESLEAMLDARAQIQAKGDAKANAFLDQLLAVRSAGFLREYVFLEYLGFLAPPAELETRLEEFARWRERSLPTLRVEVHSGIRLDREE